MQLNLLKILSFIPKITPPCICGYLNHGLHINSNIKYFFSWGGEESTDVVQFVMSAPRSRETTPHPSSQMIRISEITLRVQQVTLESLLGSYSELIIS